MEGNEHVKFETNKGFKGKGERMLPAGESVSL